MPHFYFHGFVQEGEDEEGWADQHEDGECDDGYDAEENMAGVFEADNFTIKEPMLHTCSQWEVK